MNLKINYSMFYTEQVRDFILDKITVLTNQALLTTDKKNPARVKLLLCIPDMFQMQRVQRYRDIFDEVAISRFDISAPRYWNMRHLHGLMHYCMSTDVSDRDQNIFIEQGRLVSEWPEDAKADIVVTNEYTDESLVTQYMSVIELMNESGYSIEAKDDFQCWDLSACYFSNDVKKSIYFNLCEVLQKIANSGRYINTEETYILISALLREIQDDNKDEYTFLSLGKSKTQISMQLVEHMYTII